MEVFAGEVTAIENSVVQSLNENIGELISQKTIKDISEQLGKAPSWARSQALMTTTNEMQPWILNKYKEVVSPEGGSFGLSESWMKDSVNTKSLCRDLDVQGADVLPENTERLTNGIGQLMGHLYNSTKQSYRQLYIGKFPFQGNQSALSSLFGNVVWTGPNSIETKTDDSALWEE
jgi:hypothetical protein